MNISEAIATMYGLYGAAEQLALSARDTDADQSARILAHQIRDRLFAAMAAEITDYATRKESMDALIELRTIAEAERRRELTRDALRRLPALAPVRRRYDHMNEEQLTAATARAESLSDLIRDAFGEGFEL